MMQIGVESEIYSILMDIIVAMDNSKMKSIEFGEGRINILVYNWLVIVSLGDCHIRAKLDVDGVNIVYVGCRMEEDELFLLFTSIRESLCGCGK